MSKLTKEQVEQIKFLRQEGESIVELARMFDVSKYTIKWHTDENYREMIREYQRNRYRNLSLEEKRKVREKHKPYQREYQKNRYNNDFEFRRKHLILVKAGKKKRTHNEKEITDTSAG